FKNNVANPKWISQKLNIDLKTARYAFKRLLELSYIEVHAGQFQQCQEPLITSQDVPSTTIRRYHKQHLELATLKIDSTPRGTSKVFNIHNRHRSQKAQSRKKINSKISRELSSRNEDWQKIRSLHIGSSAISPIKGEGLSNTHSRAGLITSPPSVGLDF
ncbi:MAG: DUF4423 domain-containing protein, partial [Bdellovibrionales bacterium]|nr:DUF4423 domain-containing protein [Bdellovibrionales bacterium]